MAAKKTGRKKTGATKIGKTSIKYGTKEPNNTPPAKVHPPTGKPPKTIRMLMSLANQHMSYEKGKIYRVPHQCPVPTARSWIRSGAAEMVTE